MDDPFEQIIASNLAADHAEHLKLVNAMNVVHHKANIAAMESSSKFVDAQTKWIETAITATQILALVLTVIGLAFAVWIMCQV